MPAARSRILALVSGAAATIFLLIGCSGTTHSPSNMQPARLLVWPDPPQPARIAYTRSIYRPADLGINFSAFTRVGHWLTGSDKGNEALLKPFGIALDESEL